MIKIDTFPDDDDLYVVWAYGYVKRPPALNTYPFCIVYLRRVIGDGTLSDRIEERRISVQDLDLVKIHSIWKKYSPIGRYWTALPGHFEKSVFTFRLDRTPPGIVTASKISFLHDGISFRRKENRELFMKSTFTELYDIHGTRVLVPCLETATSTMTTLRRLRGRLFLDPMDKIIDDHLLDYWELNGDYVIERRKKLSRINTVFLSHIALNRTSRSRVSRFWTSLSKVEINPDDGFPRLEKFPEVLPYHPDRLLIQCDGFSPEDGTVLVSRITGFSLPKERKILLLTHDGDIDEDPCGADGDTDETSVRSAPRILEEPEVVEVTSDREPHGRSGILKILPKVGPIKGEVPEIERIFLGSKGRARRVFSDVEFSGGTFSSGDLNERSESEGVGALRSKYDDECVEAPPDGRENGIFGDTIAAVGELAEDPSRLVESYLFVDNDGLLHRGRRYCTVPAEGLDLLTKAWSRIRTPLLSQEREEGRNGSARKKGRYARRILVMRIEVASGGACHLLDIERKGDGERFLGMVCNLPEDAGKRKEALTKLLREIARKSGHLRKFEKRDGRRTLVYNDFGIGEFTVFRHSSDREKRLSYIKRAIEEAVEKGIAG